MLIVMIKLIKKKVDESIFIVLNLLIYHNIIFTTVNTICFKFNTLICIIFSV